MAVIENGNASPILEPVMNEDGEEVDDECFRNELIQIGFFPVVARALMSRGIDSMESLC